MTYFLKSGSRFNVSSKAALDLHEKLPAGTYALKFHELSGEFYLEQIEDFEISHKLYGDTRKVTERVLRTFQARSNQTGIMLSGEKGSGKTLQAKDISIEAAKQGIPTIIINDPWKGEAFNTFMQMIEQPIVVIFDEFEKVYDFEDQSKLLTLFDGVYSSKKLFIVTCNDRHRISPQMKNRPGRIYYHLDYIGLAPEFITEYCNDNLDNKSHIDAICKISMLFSEFNFDILKALVAEMNFHKETPQESMKFLNAKPAYSSNQSFDIKLEINGKEVPIQSLDSITWTGNPFSGSIDIYHYADDKENYKIESFDSYNLVSVNAPSGTFKFTNALGSHLTLTRVKSTEMSLNSFLA